MEERRIYGLRRNINLKDNELVSCVTYSNDFVGRTPNDSMMLVTDLRRLYGNEHYYYFNHDFLKLSGMEYMDLREKALKWSNSLRNTEMEGAWKHLVAGAMAGAVSRTCTAPLDRLRVVLQASHTTTFTLRGAFFNMLSEGGLLSFWRGNGTNIIKVVPEMALKFSIYNEAKSCIKAKKSTEKLDIYERFVAGSLAGIISQSVLFPLEVIKTRMVLRKTGESSLSCIQDICKNKRGFYRGYLPNLIGIIPYAGTDLAIYETLKGHYMSWKSDKEEPNVLLLLAFGVFSSSFATIVSYPLNLVKIKLQAQKVTSQSGQLMTTTLRSILITDGVFGLYRGLLANLLKVAPSVGIGYAVYEVSRANLGATMS